jgi:hypothetical protein
MERTNAAHWLVRVGDGKHLFSSARFGIWGVSTNDKSVISFLGLSKGRNNTRKPVKNGDILWFIKGGTRPCGLIIACAEFKKSVKRIPGVTKSDSDLGWNVSSGTSNRKWDYEIRFNNFQRIESKQLYSGVKIMSNIIRYDENCKVNLPQMYKILKFEQEEIELIEEESQDSKSISSEDTQSLDIESETLSSLSSLEDIEDHDDSSQEDLNESLSEIRDLQNEIQKSLNEIETNECEIQKLLDSVKCLDFQVELAEISEETYHSIGEYLHRIDNGIEEIEEFVDKVDHNMIRDIAINIQSSMYNLIIDLNIQ